jgi:hypothetical protein
MPDQSDQPRPHGDPLEDVIDNNPEDDASEDNAEPQPERGRFKDPGATRIADIEN